MPSVPPRDTRRELFLTDGCPSCIRRRRPPESTREGQAGEQIATCLCGDCGHRWTTSWKVSR